MSYTNRYVSMDYVDMLRKREKKRNPEGLKLFEPGQKVKLINAQWVRAKAGDIFTVARSRKTERGWAYTVEEDAYGPNTFLMQYNFDPVSEEKPNQEPTTMIYLAIESTGLTERVVSDAVSEGRVHFDSTKIGDTENLLLLSDLSVQALKNRVSGIIQRNPDVTFHIFHSQMIAETSAPPVRFRSL